jgi:hypothetical protein
MAWLSDAVTVISQFAIRHGTLVAVIAAAVAALTIALRKLFEGLPTIVESIYKRRPAILAKKKEIKATKAAGKVDKIRANTDRKASRTRLKTQARVARRANVNGPDDALKLIRAIQADPDLPEKRRLPDNILGEIHTAGKKNGAGTPPGNGPSANVRRLRKPGP